MLVTQRHVSKNALIIPLRYLGCINAPHEKTSRTENFNVLFTDINAINLVSRTGKMYIKTVNSYTHEQVLIASLKG